MIYVAVLLGVFLIDLCLKKYVEAKVADDEKHEIAKGNIRIQKLHNYGFAYGVLKDKPELVKNSTLAILLVSIGYYISLLVGKGKHLLKLGFSMILGGGLCNYFDRFHQGFVTDYFSFTKGPKKLKETVFNLSDLFILLGSALSLIYGVIRLIGGLLKKK